MHSILSDVNTAVSAALKEADEPVDKADDKTIRATAVQIQNFKKKALTLYRREAAYPKVPTEQQNHGGEHGDARPGQAVLSLVGYAPQERRLFSSLPLTEDADLSEVNLPPGVSVTHIIASNSQERVQTLGDLYGPPRALPPLEPPKQPKNQAKGNKLDFYYPELAEKSTLRNNSYFTTKLPAGHFLDYSQAAPASSLKTKQHERARSLAGKKPSEIEMEMSEMESLFRGAFSSFAPCKDDSAAVVPSSVAGRLWWQWSGQSQFHNMMEVEYLDESGADAVDKTTSAADLDEKAIQDAIDSWDEMAIDPTLEDAMGVRREQEEKEADEILDEVSDLIETLASYQRIRNLTLPNSHNRQSTDPVAGDMLANPGPQPSEEEVATYHALKAQLALIVKTLPPYAVAKLNGDQLDELLISTKMQITSDQYRGVMEEDDAGVQARIRAQQQAAAAQAAARPPPQRTPSMSGGMQYQNHYQQNQYGTPTRAPSQPQFYRAGSTPNYQQSRPGPQQQGYPQQQQHRPQPNQYSRPNGYPVNQYATQLAKTQTPYGHQSMPQYPGQQRPQFGQGPQQPGTPQRYNHYQPQGYPQQQTPQPGTPQGGYGSYTNGAAVSQQRAMSPQVPPRPQYSPTPHMQPAQRYGTPAQPMSSHMNRFSSQSTPGSQQQQYQQQQQQTPNQSVTGYHSVMPEAQQQRIMEQAKARAAAQERSSSMFSDKTPGINIGSRSGSVGAPQKPTTPTPQQQGHPRPGANGTPLPQKVTPVPLPHNIPHQAQQQAAQQQQQQQQQQAAQQQQKS